MLFAMWQYLFQRQTMTPSPAKKPEKSVERGDCEKPEESVERGDWKKPASDRNQYQFSVFFKLPPELRLVIYSDLIKSGNLEVLRLCQKIHKEAIGTVSQDGIYRVKTKEAAGLYFGDAYDLYFRDPYDLYFAQKKLFEVRDESKQIRKKIQNVEVYTDLKNVTSLNIFHFSPGFATPKFISPEISGKNCWIHLTDHDMTTEMHLQQRLAVMVRTVQQFENVFLNFPGLIRHYDDPSGPSWVELFFDFGSQSDESNSERWIDELARLGPPTVHNNPDPMERYLIFHPRQGCSEGYLTTKETDGERTWLRWMQLVLA